MPDFYHFETLSSDNPFHIFYEQDNTAGSDGGYVIRRLEWASGNPGFQLTAMAKNPTEYPTVQVARRSGWKQMSETGNKEYRKLR